MKNKNKIIALALLAIMLSGGALGQLQVFADEGSDETNGEASSQTGTGSNETTSGSEIPSDGNTYGITNTGGELLGDAVIENADLIDGLTQVAGKEGTITKSSSDKWQNGYIKSGDNCVQKPYFKYKSGDSITDLYFDMTQGDYRARVQFSKIELDGVTIGSGQSIAIALDESTGMIYGGYSIWTDNTCTTRVSDIAQGLGTSKDGAVFVEVEAKLYKNGSIFTSDGTYFGIYDIDAGQSYKILNSDNLLKANSSTVNGNMYVRDKSTLQKDIDLKNRFHVNGNYIYSDESDSSGTLDIEIPGSNVYVPVTRDAQQKGLKVVFGFTQAAGSRVEYYVKQYEVKYNSDENGEITGTKQEDVAAGNNPTGSKSTPDDNYEFDHWVTDQDVVLKDGTVIKKGESITAEQIKNVVVNSNLSFTAIHKTAGEPAAKTPNTGLFTNDGNSAMFIFGIAVPSIVIIATMAAIIVERKKHQVKFN